jgi:hypothetical protein
MALDQTSESSDPAIEASTPASHRYGDALMNGVQPAAEMQALRPEVKILLMSAYRTKEIDEYRMQLELRGLFLDKPFTVAALTRAVRASGQRRHTLYWVSRIHFFSSSRSLYCAAVLRSIEV